MLAVLIVVAATTAPDAPTAEWSEAPIKEMPSWDLDDT